MKKINFRCFPISAVFLLFAITATSQDVYKLNEKESKLLVKGTSSVHDWEMNITGFTVETGLKLEHNSISEIKYIKFTAPVSRLKSSSNIMDNKAHDALKEGKFPQIKFTLEEDKPLTLLGKNPTLEGMLTIAGKTKKIKVPVDFNILSDQQFKVSGKVPLKMSDFEIEPPTAFFGTLKTDNNVEVKFDFELNKVK